MDAKKEEKQMSDESSRNEGILVFAFVEEGAAAEALETLKNAKKEKTVEYWDAAVIRKDARGHYYYNETQDRSAARGAGVGGVIGGLLGLPLGPAGILLGAGLGAGLGAFAANTDAGLDDDNVERLGQALMAGNSALLIVLSRANLSQAQEYAAQEEIEATLQKLTAGIGEHMQHGQNVAYHVTAAGRSVSCHELEAGNPFAKVLGV
jgi:uncharacterized membrane protein